MCPRAHAAKTLGGIHETTPSNISASGSGRRCAVSRVAYRESGCFTSRPVHITVGFPAGSSGLNTIARLIGQRSSDQLGQPSIIDNRPGAGSNIATEAVVQASPDGYTLLLATVSNAINATLYDDLTFNFIRDMAPVAAVSATPFILVVNRLFPAKTVSEFVTYAKLIQARSTWPRTATVAAPISLASCSRRWLTSIWFTFPIAVVSARSAERAS